jgi:hypothetical protein
MTITSYLLEAYLKCPTKCWLRSLGEQATVSACVQSTQTRNESYATAAFIENDGVPWYNSAAERALRHLAVQRKISAVQRKISGAFSGKGARDYLRLLAIAQTCRFQRKSFLGFLLSKSANLDEYKDRSRAYPDLTTNPWEKM